MTDKVHPRPFRVPELLDLQISVAQKSVLNWAYDCEKRRRAAGNPEDCATHHRDSRVWDDVQALLNELQWGLRDMESRERMPDRIHELAKRIAKTIDE